MYTPEQIKKLLKQPWDLVILSFSTEKPIEVRNETSKIEVDAEYITVSTPDTMLHDHKGQPQGNASITEVALLQDLVRIMIFKKSALVKIPIISAMGGPVAEA